MVVPTDIFMPVPTLTLLFLSNALMVPRAFIAREPMWFVGTSWGSITSLTQLLVLALYTGPGALAPCGPYCCWLGLVVGTAVAVLGYKYLAAAKVTARPLT